MLRRDQDSPDQPQSFVAQRASIILAPLLTPSRAPTKAVRDNAREGFKRNLVRCRGCHCNSKRRANATMPQGAAEPQRPSLGLKDDSRLSGRLFLCPRFTVPPCSTLLMKIVSFSELTLQKSILDRIDLSFLDAFRCSGRPPLPRGCSGADRYDDPMESWNGDMRCSSETLAWPRFQASSLAWRSGRIRCPCRRSRSLWDGAPDRCSFPPQRATVLVSACVLRQRTRLHTRPWSCWHWP